MIRAAADRAVRLLSATALAWGLVLPSVPARAQAPAAEQSTSVSGVTVKVTARDIEARSPAWRFGVVLDTHSQDLSDDLLASARLRTDDGREYQPTGWTGAAPGGHHREGTLEFAAPDPRPAAFELLISRPGEAEPRRFRWPQS